MSTNISTTKQQLKLVTEADGLWKNATDLNKQIDKNKVDKSFLPRCIRRIFGFLTDSEKKQEAAQKSRQTSIEKRVQSVLVQIPSNNPHRAQLQMRVKNIFENLYPKDFSKNENLANGDKLAGYTIRKDEKVKDGHSITVIKGVVVGEGATCTAKFYLDLATCEIGISGRVLLSDEKKERNQARSEIEEYIIDQAGESEENISCLMVNHGRIESYQKKDGTTGRLFLMKYMEEGTLVNRTVVNKVERVEPKSMDNAEEALSVIHDILTGLVQLKKLGILHRDIKSQNIFLYKDPETKKLHAMIADFDSSVNINNLDLYDTDYGRTDGCFGTPCYYYPQLHCDILSIEKEEVVAKSCRDNEIFGAGIALMTIIDNKEPDWCGLDSMPEKVYDTPFSHAQDLIEPVKKFKKQHEATVNNNINSDKIFNLIYSMVATPNYDNLEATLELFDDLCKDEGAKKEFIARFNKNRKTHK